jgi:hypothetical protein
MPNFASEGIERRNMKNRSLLGKEAQGVPNEHKRCVLQLTASYVSDNSTGKDGPSQRWSCKTPEAQCGGTVMTQLSTKGANS